MLFLIWNFFSKSDKPTTKIYKIEIKMAMCSRWIKSWTKTSKSFYEDIWEKPELVFLYTVRMWSPIAILIVLAQPAQVELSNEYKKLLNGYVLRNFFNFYPQRCFIKLRSRLCAPPIQTHFSNMFTSLKSVFLIAKSSGFFITDIISSALSNLELLF